MHDDLSSPFILGSQFAAPRLRYIVDENRTVREERQYHRKALRLFHQFVRLIGRAERIFHGGSVDGLNSLRVRELRRQLFEAHLIQARTELLDLSMRSDALPMIDETEYLITKLANDTGAYLSAYYMPERVAARLRRDLDVTP
jgi:hypothetical protein